MDSDPLAQLRDIHLPETISWWPLAPGWWALIIMLGLVIGWFVFKGVQRHRSNLYRRQALATLLTIETSGGSQTLAAIFALLKQTANIAYPSQQASSLSIEKFVPFLQTHCTTSVFSDLPDNLSAALYSSSDQESQTLELRALNEQVLASAKTWVIEHKAEAKP